eukprot:GHRR01034350.1.p1 GENE.GHRR01034350.1~~GHRR01034350.1.p1  ORF type:complete len:131 (+),score=34.58 GHRR01034350.1:528-920(+)
MVALLNSSQHLALQELKQEQGMAGVQLTADNLDRVIVSRLIESPPEQYPQTPFNYLLGCFARCSNELRNISPRDDAATTEHLQQTIMACRTLLVSYAALALTGTGVVPEVWHAENCGMPCQSASSRVHTY